MTLNKLIKSIVLREIITSRGYPTVEIDVLTDFGLFRASCPSGASTGSKEAVVVLDEEERYNGRGVLKVIKNVKEYILPKILSLECCITDQKIIDENLIQMNLTPSNSPIGVNGTLPLSVVFCKAAAAHLNMKLHSYISKISNCKPKMPIPHFNVLNGGMHSGNDMSVQEIMVAFQYDNIRDNIEAACVLYETIKETISKKYGAIYTSVGDEGGFAPPIKTIDEGIAIIEESARICKRTKYKIALDLAANEFFNKGHYKIDGKLIKSEDMVDFYLNLLKKHQNIYSLEDPFHETDYSNWGKLMKLAGQKINIVGDDLTVTNPKLVKYAAENKLCNILLVKINQIGTITETLKSVDIARKNNMKIMVSHRSGETVDEFISDLAYGIGAEYFKSGAPCRGERVEKYNQLLRLSE